MKTTPAPAALLAYERLAPVYDRFTDSYDHDGWVDRLEELARRHGLRGRRLLDVACGTGKSFVPLARRGYDVWACDLSPAMVALARHATKAVAPARVIVADMRQLPELGAFDLVTCLDDAVNYLLDDDELLAAFTGVARLLAPGGLYLFDANSLSTYRDGFTSRATFERPLADAIWRGETTGPIAPGAICSASIEIGGGPRAAVSRHVQRHHPQATIRALLASAGLDCRAVLGQSPGGVLHEDADEEAHTKLVYVARRPA